VKSLLAAIAFLTRIPAGRLAAFDESAVARSSGWFPLVGALLGATYCTAAALLKGHLPAPVIAVLIVVLDALLTGALHYDGLADTADGFGGGHTREDILRIMRDHAIGTYGGVALITAIALKVTAYNALLHRTDWMQALILTPALARWSVLLLTVALPYVRPSTSPAEGMGKWPLIWGTLLVITGLITAMSARAWAAAAITIAITALFGSYCRHRIAGITGDTLGANVQLCETAALLTFIWTGSQA
jgi:cobalamin 5'-phosphate synthase/cobalamin synthase